MEKIGELELNKTHLGDCIKLSKHLPDDSVDLIVTSPPYANTVSYGNEIETGVETFNPENYVDWFLQLFYEAQRFLKPTGVSKLDSIMANKVMIQFTGNLDNKYYNNITAEIMGRREPSDVRIKEVIKEFSMRVQIGSVLR